jgi:excinuclease ABC subunit B
VPGGVPTFVGDDVAPATGPRPARELAGLIADLTERMHAAAADLQFELAARLRDEVADLKKELRSMQAAGAG